MIEISKMYNKLADEIIASGTSMVSKERFITILNIKDYIDKLDGDVVECGIWRGGMSIFLSELFKNKHIWACDSFEGFQPLGIAKYEFGAERHTDSYDNMIKVAIDDVIANFKLFGIKVPNDRITFLSGWVKDTLDPSVCPIDKISLLRIDVDAYSATKETLEFLYSKVVTGGVIIFDDSCLYETVHAFCDFFTENGIKINLLTPAGETIEFNHNSVLPCGCYFIKP